MLKIKEYVKAESLEQAFELNQKRTNQIIGGMLWMKMGDHRIQTAIRQQQSPAGSQRAQSPGPPQHDKAAPFRVGTSLYHTTAEGGFW